MCPMYQAQLGCCCSIHSLALTALNTQLSEMNHVLLSFSVGQVPQDKCRLSPSPSLQASAGVIPGYFVLRKCTISVITQGMSCCRTFASYGATNRHLRNLPNLQTTFWNVDSLDAVVPNKIPSCKNCPAWCRIPSLYRGQ